MQPKKIAVAVGFVALAVVLTLAAIEVWRRRGGADPVAKIADVFTPTPAPATV